MFADVDEDRAGGFAAGFVVQQPEVGEGGEGGAEGVALGMFAGEIVESLVEGFAPVVGVGWAGWQRFGGFRGPGRACRGLAGARSGCGRGGGEADFQGDDLADFAGRRG